MDIVDAMQSQAKALADPSRFRLLRFIADADEPVGVAELTDFLGFNHNAIRQHLAVLVEAKLITESNEDRKVRGRPRKQYQLRSDALSAFGSVSGSYERLAELLLAVAEGEESPFDIGYRAGHSGVDHNTDVPAPDLLAQLERVLAAEGFEPGRDSADTITLNNCPFAGVAAKNPGVICELHRGLINGQIDSRSSDVLGVLEPRDPHAAGCLVRIENRAVEQ